MEKFKFVISKLEEDLAHAKRDLEATKETIVAEYKESKAFSNDVADGCAEVFEIVFARLICMKNDVFYSLICILLLILIL